MRELNAAENVSDKQDLLEYLKSLKTKDEVLSGALLFLADSNWDLGALQQRVTSLEHFPPRIAQRSKVKVLAQRSMKYAALLLFPLGVWVIYHQFLAPPIIDRYYLSEPGLPNFMGSLSDREWDQAMASYKHGDYPTALAELNAMNKERNNDTLLYFKGVTHYEMQNYAAARACFSELVVNKNSVFIFDTEYRLGFALYKLGNVVASKDVFQAIASNKNHPFTNEVQALMADVFAENKP